MFDNYILKKSDTSPSSIGKHVSVCYIKIQFQLHDSVSEELINLGKSLSFSQGSYGHEKPGKVREFEKSNFQIWKRLGK